MTKKKLAILEKCFATEVDSALRSNMLPLHQMRDSKVVRELIEEGMIVGEEVILEGRFPMHIKGYVLTLLGHMTYCESCK